MNNPGRIPDLVFIPRSGKPQEFLDSPRESPWGTTQREDKAGLECDVEQYREIDRYCKEKRIAWFASAWITNNQ